MFLVRTFIDNSDIHDLGVFTSVDIKKGDLVWEYNSLIDISFTEEEFHSLPPTTQYFIVKAGWGVEDKYYIALDHDQFSNHCDDPNLKEIENGSLIAARDIKAGEELTQDYYKYHRNKWSVK
jgi:SET domain-containing protein